ncbi:zinc knuckle CX2CX4HX4C containing protein, partial [Tanacetum coccineum]
TMVGVVDINTLTMEQYLALSRENQAPGVDVVLLRVFPFTLTGTANRWVDRLTPRAVNTWDLLKKAFIQRYYPPSKTAKRLEDIHNFKLEIDESLYCNTPILTNIAAEANLGYYFIVQQS